MGTRALLLGSLLFFALRCATDEDPKSNGEPSSDGASGESTGGSRSGSGGTARGGRASGGSSGSGARAGTGGSGTGGTGRSGEAGEGGDTSGAGGAGSGGEPGGEGGEGGSAPDDTVSGIVLGRYLGIPTEPVAVSIGSTTAYTDADGHFAIPNVPPTYDLVMIEETAHHALVLHGLTKRSLTLPGTNTNVPVSARRTATVRGVITGADGLPLPVDHLVSAGYLSSTSILGRSNAVNAGGAYSFGCSWPLSWPSSVDGTLYALSIERETVEASSRVTGFDGYGTKALTVHDMETLGNQDGSTPETNIALAPISTHTLSGALTVPIENEVQVSLISRYMGLQPDYLDYFGTPPPETYSLLLPAGLPTSTVVLLAMFRYVGEYDTELTLSQQLVPDTMGTLDLAALEPPKQLLPTDGAVDVDFGTEFAWTRPPGSVGMIAFKIGDWSVEVTSAVTTAKIPDLRDYGVAFSPLDPGSWFAKYLVGATTVDEWVEMGSSGLGHDGRRVDGASLTRQFTLTE